MKTKVETIIAGGGQAGLAVSYYLSRHERRHIVLEQAAAAGNTWRNRRWDSFTLTTPNWQSALPGAEIPGNDPDGFLARDEIVSYFENYVKRFSLPVQYGVWVEAVDRDRNGTGYTVRTSGGEFEAENVVIATGLHQYPKIPSFSGYLPPWIKQMHCDHYRNPQSLPDGSVLVVGSAQSGAQIAYELNQSGRKVYLSTCCTGRVPRRYRGKDANWWQQEMGVYERSVDQLPSPRAKFAGWPRHFCNDAGCYRISLHQLARDGVVLVGRANGIHGERLLLVPNLKSNMAKDDEIEADFVKRVDEYIAAHNIDAPEEALPELRDGYDLPDPDELNLREENIKAVIWSTGYKFDFSFVHLPVLDGDGYPIQKRGVTAFPGLCFVGLPWLHNAKSGLLAGLKDDAAHIAASIVKNSDRFSASTPAIRSAASDRGSEEHLPFAGKVALITGGTSGIGEAAARRVAELGAAVVLTGRRDSGRAVAASIVQKGGRAVFFQADVAVREQVRKIVPFVVGAFGRLDFAFNNAGTSGTNALLIDQTEENFDSVFSVNVKAMFILLQDEIRQMMHQGTGGSIVNSSSVNALVATPTAGHYGASKHAVLGLTRTAAIEYGQYGIRVNAVTPGAVRTEMLLNVVGSRQAIDQMATIHPLGRVGDPGDIANAVVWLFSDQSSYYTGQFLTLDGGLTALRPTAMRPIGSANGKTPALKETSQDPPSEDADSPARNQYGWPG